MMEKKIDEQSIPMVSAHALGEILKDFSNGLSLLRDMGVNSVDLSPDTVKLMDQWQRGKFRPMAIPVRPEVHTSPPKKTAGPSTRDPSLVPGTSQRETRDTKPSEAVPQKPVIGEDVSMDGSTKIQNITMPTIQGRGTGDARIFFLCEASTLDENQQPDITKGPAGDLFLKILKAMNLDVNKVYIISFQPPASQADVPDEEWQKEIKTHVFKKMRQFDPQIICSMGEKALQVMLGNDAHLADGEGRFHNMATTLFIPTFHPAQLIENPSLKRAVWESMKRVIQRIKQS